MKKISWIVSMFFALIMSVSALEIVISNVVCAYQAEDQRSEYLGRQGELVFNISNEWARVTAFDGVHTGGYQVVTYGNENRMWHPDSTDELKAEVLRLGHNTDPIWTTPKSYTLLPGIYDLGVSYYFTANGNAPITVRALDVVPYNRGASLPLNTNLMPKVKGSGIYNFYYVGEEGKTNNVLTEGICWLTPSGGDTTPIYAYANSRFPSLNIKNSFFEKLDVTYSATIIRQNTYIENSWIKEGVIGIPYEAGKTGTVSIVNSTLGENVALVREDASCTVDNTVFVMDKTDVYSTGYLFSFHTGTTKSGATVKMTDSKIWKTPSQFCNGAVSGTKLFAKGCDLTAAATSTGWALHADSEIIDCKGFPAAKVASVNTIIGSFDETGTRIPDKPVPDMGYDGTVTIYGENAVGDDRTTNIFTIAKGLITNYQLNP